MFGKRGQGLSTNAIILIVLGVVVLAVLILGFTVGWARIAPWISTNNVDSISTACSVACSTQSTFGFCSEGRDLRAEDTELNGVTCNYLANNQPQYGIESCSQITCDNVVIVEAASQEDLESKCEGNEGKTVQALVGNDFLSHSCSA